MRKYWTLIFLITTILLSHAQDSKLSFTVSYPYPFDSNFVGENYTGVADIGLQYRFIKINPVAIGASLHGSNLVFQDHPSPLIDKINALFIQPRIFAELRDIGLQNFRPSLGLGYTFTNFKAKGDGGGDDLTENLSGININLGFYFDITSHFFTHLHYDFVKISPADGVPDVKENTNINQLKIGVGFNF